MKIVLNSTTKVILLTRNFVSSSARYEVTKKTVKLQIVYQLLGRKPLELLIDYTTDHQPCCKLLKAAVKLWQNHLKGGSF